MWNKVHGSITVFFSLILLLITAVLCTVVESARMQSIQGIGKSYVVSGVDSVLSSYQRELYDRYKIFGYPVYTEEGQTKEDKISQEVKDYITNHLEDETILNLGEKKADILSNFGNIVDLLNISCGEVDTQNLTMLTDCEGELFRNEVLEYMKYAVPTDLVADLLKRMKVYNNVQETTQVMKKELETQESISQIDKDMLQLLSYVEGVKTDEDGIKVSKNNKLKVNHAFVKKILNAKPTNQSTGITNAIVFTSLQSEYSNFDYRNQKLMHYCKENIKCFTLIEQKKESITVIEKSISELEQERSNIVITDNDEHKEEKEARKKELTSSIDSLRDQCKELTDGIHTLNESITDKSKHYNNMINACRVDIERVLDQSNKALDTILQIKEKRGAIVEKINDFDETIEEHKAKLSEDEYASYQEELQGMKQYIGLNKEKKSILATDIASMEEIIKYNKEILMQIIALYTEISESSISGMTLAMNDIRECTQLLQGYQVNGLVFDYSSIVMKEDTKNPVDSICDLLENGVLSLITDNPDSISDKKVDDANLPSQLSGSSKIESTFDLYSLLKNCKGKEYNNEITDTFTFQENKGEDLVETLLLNQYQMNFFSNYCKVQNNTQESRTYKEEFNKNAEKATRYQYETEYILGGGETDRENMTRIGVRIIMLRTVINYLYLFTDKEKGMQAYATAAALVGFTCLAPLVTLMKYVILFVWAVEEAIVDTYALLSGKSVPFIKTKQTFKVTFSNLYCFNKQTIIRLSNTIKNDARVIGNFNYEMYLRIFLMINGKLDNCYRSMDVIQLSMQQMLGDRFRMQDCVFGLNVSGDISIPRMFVIPSFIQEILGKTDRLYSNTVRYTTAY